MAWHSIRSTSCGRPARLLVGRSHGPELPLGAGGQQVAVDVVGQADAADQAVDRVALPERVVQPLEHEEPRPLADDQAVALTSNGRRLAPGRERPELGEAHLGVERIGPRDAAGDHGVGPARPQLVDGQLERVERRGAGGVERERRAPQPQRLGHQRRGQPGGKGVQRVGRPRLERTEMPSPSSMSRPRTSRENDDDRSVGRTMLPKITPTRRRSSDSVRADFQADRAAWRARWKTGSSRLTSAGSRSKPARSSCDLGDEAPAGGVDLVEPRDPAGRRPRPGEQPAAGGDLGGRSRRPRRCSPRTAPGRSAPGKIPP